MALPADLASTLRAFPMFGAFDDDQFRELARAMQPLELAPRQLLFQRGDAAEHFYIVLEGSVRLVLQSRDGQEKVVERLGPGQSFGEALMFLAAPAFPLAAIALEASRVLAVPSQAFRTLLRESPDTGMRMLADLSRRLHAMVREIEDLTLESATRRLTRHLLGHATDAPEGGAVVTLDETKQQLASRLAMKPETLSRILRSLSDAGMIAVDGRSIRVLDAARLRTVG